MKNFAAAHEIAFVPTEQASLAAIARDFVLFRPWSPRGNSPGGLWLSRNPNHPKIWGWLVGVHCETIDARPSLRPGTMVVVARHQGEVIERFSHSDGEESLTIALPIDAIQLAINPPLVEMRVLS